MEQKDPCRLANTVIDYKRIVSGEDNIKRFYPEIALWAPTMCPMKGFTVGMLMIFTDNTFLLRYYSPYYECFFETPVLPMECVENSQVVREYRLKKVVEDLLE